MVALRRGRMGGGKVQKTNPIVRFMDGPKLQEITLSLLINLKPVFSTLRDLKAKFKEFKGFSHKSMMTMVLKSKL